MKRINPLTKKFRKGVRLEFDRALATHVAYVDGTKTVRALARQHPGKKVEIKEHPSSTMRSTLHWGLTYKQILNQLTNPSNNVAEIFHGRILQLWFDFLGEIFRCMAQDQLTGRRNWGLQKMKFEIDFKEYASRISSKDIVELMHRSFSFLPNPKKHEIVFKALKSTDYARGKIDSIRSEIETIEKNVTIRNILQHNRGRVRSANLKGHGVKYFEVIISDSKTVKVGANKKIYITLKDIDNMTKAMSNVAEQIRKSWIVSMASS